MRVGIEAINCDVGQAFIDVRDLIQTRGLDAKRFEGLMMEKKSVSLPCEDPVTYAVNAAKPIVDALGEEGRQKIEMVITATESGLDFGKSLSPYVQDHLGLGRKCRLFEVKQACYAGTAGLQMASHFVAANVSPGAKVLVIATDVARAAVKNTYAEPSQGAAAVAMLVSDAPDVLALDLGANGYHSYEVMDTCRPEPQLETGDPDLSVLSYLDCLASSWKAYAEKVPGADFQRSFDLLAFHTPFGAMVKGAHRKMMRDLKQAPPPVTEADFESRVRPSLRYCVEVGNVYSATLYLALCSLIDHAAIDGDRRVGLFSYGSGCSSEFFSGVVPPTARGALTRMGLRKALDGRYKLNMDEYDRVLDLNLEWLFGVKDKYVDVRPFGDIYGKQLEGRGRLVLKRVWNYHREYAWS